MDTSAPENINALVSYWKPIPAYRLRLRQTKFSNFMTSITKVGKQI